MGSRKVKSGNAKEDRRAFGDSNPTPVFHGQPHNGVHYGGADGKETVEHWDCSPDCAVRLLDEQSGERKSGAGNKNVRNRGNGLTIGHGLGQGNGVGVGGDTGGASRFYYTAKSSRRERNAGLPEGVTNHHPTVKSLSVMRWLCRLVTPPGGIILDPFAGSGSTGCAAELEGFRSVLIEQDPEYLEIARRRVAYWARIAPRYRRFVGYLISRPPVKERVDPQQTSLFGLAEYR